MKRMTLLIARIKHNNDYINSKTVIMLIGRKVHNNDYVNSKNGKKHSFALVKQYLGC